MIQPDDEMPTRQDGTEPIIAHGSVYLRGPEREDVRLFVAWMNDYRTSRTLAIRAPLSGPLEEAWFERMVADQGKGGYFFVACLLADGTTLRRWVSGGRSSRTRAT